MKPTLEEMFTYHAPKNPAQLQRYKLVRDKGLEFAQAICAATPVCADQTAAIRKVREAVMTANAAIALEFLRAG